ncbi:hypothetical protein K1719_022938 [Acacia pycnantha]|nr:hypothetical protein K1719_022938 [Acacia pycnantha]
MGMQVLIEHSLVKVVNDKIHVHDLLQKMGSEVTKDKQKFTYIYDVFLSFRGEDTCKSIATHLYTTLKQAESMSSWMKKGLQGENTFQVHYYRQLKVLEFQSSYSHKIMQALVGA